MHQIAIAQWAHDIRNTLATVALYVETLERPAEPRTTNVVASTQALLAKAAALCSDAVRRAGQDAAAATARRSGFDVAATMRQIGDLIRPTLPASATLQVASDPVRVLADPQDVFRILFNLVHNAATVARRGGMLRRIRLAVERTGTTAVITISDDGPGLPEAVRARLFRPGDVAGRASGLGLAIARELAERNGGSLKLAAVSFGTAFVLELPLDVVVPRRAAMPAPMLAAA